LSSHSRLHGSSSYRVPWLYDDEAVDTVRFFTKLKCRLMPYLYQQAKETSETGVPLMRAMLLEFPEDPNCDQLDRQYMLGETVLVAPVFNYESVASYYVPAGVWTDLLTGRTCLGPMWVKEEIGFLAIPLLARPNSIVAFGAVDNLTSYGFGKGVTFVLCGLEDGGSTSCKICSEEGTDLGGAIATRTGSQIRFEVNGDISDWSVVFAGHSTVSGLENSHSMGACSGILEGPAVVIGTLL
jgi:alpha-D-xyloside xylohydrolase